MNRSMANMNCSNSISHSYCLSSNLESIKEITLPSIVFILRDVFARHRLWNYQKPSDRIFIGKLCLEIFVAALKASRKLELKNDYLLNEHVTVIMLMEGPCAETLLHMLADSEQEIVRNVLKTGNETIFQKNPSILSIRLVLRLISKLLEVYPGVKKSSNHSNVSVIEENLFSSSVHSREYSVDDHTFGLSEAGHFSWKNRYVTVGTVV